MEVTISTPYTTADRLNYLIASRNLRQVDIVRMAKPYCEMFNIKLNRNDLSQYVNGKTKPKQKKLTVLGLALNVSEAWLMGYDVPMERQPTENVGEKKNRIIIIYKDGEQITRELTDIQVELFKAMLDNLTPIDNPDI